jgi:hypothetical protein
LVSPNSSNKQGGSRAGGIPKNPSSQLEIGVDGMASEQQTFDKIKLIKMRDPMTTPKPH